MASITVEEQGGSQVGETSSAVGHRSVACFAWTQTRNASFIIAEEPGRTNSLAYVIIEVESGARSAVDGSDRTSGTIRSAGNCYAGYVDIANRDIVDASGVVEHESNIAGVASERRGAVDAVDGEGRAGYALPCN